MASRKSSIGAELVIDRRQFTKALADSRGDATRFAASLEAIKAPRTGALSGDMGGWNSGIKGVIGRYQHLKTAVTDVGAAAVRLAGAPAMYADMMDGLTAVTGSAEEAGDAMKFIAAVANEQKLEFEPLVEAYQHMRALGYSTEQTTQFIREMGNAIEATGGDAGDLTAAVSALAKIGDKGAVSAKALHGMAEQMPFLRTIFRDVFGAETAADIEKLDLSSQELYDGIVRGLKRVETAQGGALDTASPEYLASMARLRAGRASAGEGALIPSLPDRVASAADPAADAEKLKFWQQRAADDAAAKAKAKKAAAEKAGLATLEAEDAISRKKLELETAIAAKAKERQQTLELELAMLTEGKQIMEKTGLAAEVVQDFLDKRLSREREITKLQQEAEQTTAAPGQADALEIARLRSQGKNKKADKLSADRTEKDRAAALVAGGMNEKDAAALAKDERKIADDQAYLDRTGRRKMRGATNAGNFVGLDGMKFSDRSMGMSDEWNFDKLDAAKKDRRNRPLKSAQDRAAGKPAITPDAFNGAGIEQVPEIVALLRAIRDATLGNRGAVADKLQPRRR